MVKRLEVVKSDQVILYERLKDELLASIADARCPDENGRTQPSAVAALSKELRAVQTGLDELGQKGKASVANELAERSAARRATAADRPPSARRSQSRRSNGSHRAS